MSYEFNMVDMGGIDIATVNGTVVEGLYNKLLEGMDACGNLILYNWKFAEIEIVPSACSVLIEDEAIIVNGTIRVDNSDFVSLIWADPPPVPVEPLTVTANGVYTAQAPTSGFNPVSVNVPTPAPRLIPIVIVANGEYTPPADVDGFNHVTVNVSEEETIIPIVDASSTFVGVSPKYPTGAFGNVAGNFWGADGTSAWFNINFQTPHIVNKILLSNYYRLSTQTYWYSSSITVRASNDGFSTYTDLYTGTGLAQSDMQFEIDLNNSVEYLEYRLILNDSTAYVGLGRIVLQ